MYRSNAAHTGESRDEVVIGVGNVASLSEAWTTPDDVLAGTVGSPPTALQLTVFDIEAARAALVGRGVDVGVFYDVGAVFHHASTEGRVSGPDPERRDCGSFAAFSDPDGNGWLLQEVKKRSPGR